MCHNGSCIQHASELIMDSKQSERLYGNWTHLNSHTSERYRSSELFLYCQIDRENVVHLFFCFVFRKKKSRDWSYLLICWLSRVHSISLYLTVLYPIWYIYVVISLRKNTAYKYIQFHNEHRLGNYMQSARAMTLFIFVMKNESSLHALQELLWKKNFYGNERSAGVVIL